MMKFEEDTFHHAFQCRFREKDLHRNSLGGAYFQIRLIFVKIHEK